VALRQSALVPRVRRAHRERDAGQTTSVRLCWPGYTGLDCGFMVYRKVWWMPSTFW